MSKKIMDDFDNMHEEVQGQVKLEVRYHLEELGRIMDHSLKKFRRRWATPHGSERSHNKTETTNPRDAENVKDKKSDEMRPSSMSRHSESTPRDARSDKEMISKQVASPSTARQTKTIYHRNEHNIKDNKCEEMHPLSLTRHPKTTTRDVISNKDRKSKEKRSPSTSIRQRSRSPVDAEFRKSRKSREQKRSPSVSIRQRTGTSRQGFDRKGETEGRKSSSGNSSPEIIRCHDGRRGSSREKRRTERRDSSKRNTHH